MKSRITALCTLVILLGCTSVNAKTARHYVFFGQDREALVKAKAFFETKAAEGAQVTYTWRQLEPRKDVYDFSYIHQDLALLASKDKKLFIQLQDVTFIATRINVPRYLLDDPRFNGGANQQFEETPSHGDGWVARRWDPAVQERFHKLLFALGKEFDGKIEGINLAESSIGFGKDESKFPKGFTYEAYRDGLIVNMKALKRAFPKSVTIQYANFMPGEWLPADDKGYLRAIYKAAQELKVGVGGPDLLPYRRGQRSHSYPLIQAASDQVPTGIAVQDGNFEDVNPENGKRITIAELVAFATDYLKVDYIFWGTQEPYYSEQVVPFLQAQTTPKTAAANPTLRQELLDRVLQDQAIRNKLILKGIQQPDQALLARMHATDSENTSRMKEIIKLHGWPGPELVGEDGTEAAFMLVQHADHEFQKQVLRLVRQAYRSRKLSGQNYALLLDRVLVGEGKRQVYGTQAKPINNWKAREPVLYPIEDEKNVDKRRAQVGLPPLADYLKMLKEMYFPYDKVELP